MKRWDTRHLVVHTTATPFGKDFSAKDIDRMHRQRGFASIGYHYLIRLDGTVEPGRPEDQVGAHVAGHNSTSIGISYVGGLGPDGKPADTRTPAQKKAMERLLLQLKVKYPRAAVLGHRDFPGVKKACPCFDARAWWLDTLMKLRKAS
jgi:N-acetylmuramoyl-L-alanine amidase